MYVYHITGIRRYTVHRIVYIRKYCSYIRTYMHSAIRNRHTPTYMYIHSYMCTQGQKVGKKGNKQLGKMEEVRRFKFNNVISMCVVKLLKHFQLREDKCLLVPTNTLSLQKKLLYSYMYVKRIWWLAADQMSHQMQMAEETNLK